MTFEEVLPALKAGKRAKRDLWAELNGKVGDWLELVTSMTAGERDIIPSLMMWNTGGNSLRPWGGANRDVLADDWEIL